MLRIITTDSHSWVNHNKNKNEQNVHSHQVIKAFPIYWVFSFSPLPNRTVLFATTKLNIIVKFLFRFKTTANINFPDFNKSSIKLSKRVKIIGLLSKLSVWFNKKVKVLTLSLIVTLKQQKIWFFKLVFKPQALFKTVPISTHYISKR